MVIGGEKCGVENPEADFLALHVAVRSGDAEMMMDGIAGRFRPPAKHHAAEKQRQHRRPHRPAVVLVLDHAAEVVSQPAADGEDRQHLDEI